MKADPLQSLTGDAPAAQVLRRSMTSLAHELDGTPLGYRLREVLTGERDVRSLADDPEYAEITRAGMDAFAVVWGALGPEEKAAQLRAGEAYLDSLDESAGTDPP